MSTSPNKEIAERLKACLLQLHEPKVPFGLSFTNRVNAKVLGTYYPHRRHIFVHGGRGGFEHWLDTAILEYAHHIHFTENDLRSCDRRDHGKTFNLINNALLHIARNKQMFGRSSIFNHTETP